MSLIGPNPYRITDRDRPTARQVQDFHTNADVDGSPKSLHHTLGPGPTQAAPGNHSHDAGSSTALSGYALVNHNHDTSYWKVNVPWIALPFQNSWTDYGASGYQVCGYRLVGDEVQCRGLMKHATVSTTGTFAQLPVGYRPLNNRQFLGVASVSGFCDIRVLNTGVMSIQAYGTGFNGGSVSLDMIRFSIN